jgi:hypothetical protein
LPTAAGKVTVSVTVTASPGASVLTVLDPGVRSWIVEPTIVAVQVLPTGAASVIGLCRVKPAAKVKFAEPSRLSLVGAFVNLMETGLVDPAPTTPVGPGGAATTAE